MRRTNNYAIPFNIHNIEYIVSNVTRVQTNYQVTQTDSKNN